MYKRQILTLQPTAVVDEDDPIKQMMAKLRTSGAIEAARLQAIEMVERCLLYTSDAADERSSVDLGGRRIIKQKTKKKHRKHMIL